MTSSSLPQKYPQNHLTSSAQLIESMNGIDHTIDWISTHGIEYPTIFEEFWTSKQRQSSSIHEISYRACFKAQLPAFFIERFTREGDIVYDPFSGRGTTVIEAGLSGRRVIANDINPLSSILSQPRFSIPSFDDLAHRLESIPLLSLERATIDLSMFYHPKTESEIVSLRNYLERRRNQNKEDDLDRWIRMVATNRLSGHSAGFFSVYSLPPNQAVTQAQQIRINKRLQQKPEYRDTKKIILKKSRSLVRNLTAEQRANLHQAGESAIFLNQDARETQMIAGGSVQLTVTSPPFLDIVNYSQDNWLRCWFNELDAKRISSRITHARTVEQWSDVMRAVFQELYRITAHKGWLIFEVGELRKGTLKLEEHVIPLGLDAGFECAGIMINTQQFTKTSNIWGVRNNLRGTNSNRMVVFHKP